MALENIIRTRGVADGSGSYAVLLNYGLLLEVAALSHAGKVKKRNQDNVLAKRNLIVLCDGLDNPENGESASELVCTYFGEYAFTADGHSRNLADVASEARQVLLSKIPSDVPADQRMGCTLVAGLFHQTEMLVYTSVGDSPLFVYREREGRAAFEQITRNQTISLAISSHGEKKGHLIPKKYNLPACLGGPLSFNATPIRQEAHPYAAGETYLFCSDGLSDMVPQVAIREILRESFARDPENLEAACQALVAAANTAGGKGNISVVLARIREIPLPLLYDYAFPTYFSDNSPALLQMIERNKERLRHSQDSKGNFLMAVYSEQNNSIDDALSFYEQCVWKTPEHEQTFEEGYFSSALHKLLTLYTHLYSSPQNYKLFLHKMATLRQKYLRRTSLEEQINCLLLEKVKSVEDHDDIYLRLIKEQIECGNLERAFETLEHAAVSYAAPTKEDKQRQKSYIHLAKACFEEKAYADAIAITQKGIAECPFHEKILAYKQKLTEAFCEKGVAALESGHYRRAKNRFLETLSLEPDHIDAHYYLGQVLFQKEEFDDAQLQLETALTLIQRKQEMDERYSERIKKSTVYLALAHVHSAHTHYEEAATALRLAYQCAPRNKTIADAVSEMIEILQEQAKRLLNNKNYNIALSHLTAAQRLGASGSWLAWRIGKCYEGLRDYDAARQQYATISEENPAFTNAQIGLSRIEKLHGR